MWRSFPRLVVSTPLTGFGARSSSHSVQVPAIQRGLPKIYATSSTESSHPRSSSRPELSSLGAPNVIDKASRRRNFRIIHLGQKGNWDAMANLYWQERKDWNVVNIMTLLHQLSTIKDLNVKNRRVEMLLLDSAKLMKDQMKNGITVDNRQLRLLQKSLWELKPSPLVAEQLASMLPLDTKNNDTTKTTSAGSTIFAAKEINDELLELGKNNDWQGILHSYEIKINQFNSINYATALTQLAKCSNVPKDDPRLQQILREINKQLMADDNTWKARGIVNVLHSMAKLKLETPRAKELVTSITRRNNLLRIVQRGNAQDISNLAWSCATLGVISLDLQQLINDQASILMETGTPQAIANTAWACATMGIKCHLLFLLIDKHAEKIVSQGSTQNIANIAWACAQLGFPCKTFLDTVDRAAKQLVSKGKPQEVANTAWSFATLGYKGKELFATIETNATPFVTNAKGQEMANTAWACATLGIVCPNLFENIDRYASRLIKSGDVQTVANTVWAFATLNIPCPTLIEQIDKSAYDLVNYGTTQEIANLAWSVVKLEQESPYLFAAIEKRWPWLAEHGTPLEISNMIWAFGQLNLYSPVQLKSINDQATTILSPTDPRSLLDPQWIATTALCLANLDQKSTTFFNMVCRNMDVILEKGSNLHISNLCYAFAVLDLPMEHDYEGEFRKLWDKAITLNPTTDLDQGMQIQLLQTYVMVSNRLDIPPPNNLLQSSTSLILPAHRSKAQKVMSTLLREIGFSHDMEVSPFPDNWMLPKGLLAIDAACTEKKIAIEFNGPQHFVRDLKTGTTLLHKKDGPTIAKRRLLEHLGWKVIDIDFFEWAQRKTKAARKQLLVQKLQNTPLETR